LLQDKHPQDDSQTHTWNDKLTLCGATSKVVALSVAATQGSEANVKQHTRKEGVRVTNPWFKPVVFGHSTQQSITDVAIGLEQSVKAFALGSSLGHVFQLRLEQHVRSDEQSNLDPAAPAYVPPVMGPAACLTIPDGTEVLSWFLATLLVRVCDSQAGWPGKGPPGQFHPLEDGAEAAAARSDNSPVPPGETEVLSWFLATLLVRVCDSPAGWPGKGPPGQFHQFEDGAEAAAARSDNSPVPPGEWQPRGSIPTSTSWTA
jgi:hypothetical protein